MLFFHSSSLANVGSTFKSIPRGTIKGLFIRFSGTAQSGQTVALADLGRFRVNYRSTDTVNASSTLLSQYLNLKFGVAEFSSTISAAFSAAFYIPFHAVWDQVNGMFFNDDEAYIQLDFPALTSALIATGTVEVFYITAPQVAQYINLLLQRNQLIGSGSNSQLVNIENVSSLYVIEDSDISSFLVNADGSEKINGSQAALKSYSNAMNRVETAITLYELNLNPFQQIMRTLNREVKVQIQATGADNVNMLVHSFAFNDTMTQRSVTTVAEEVRRAYEISDSAKLSGPRELTSRAVAGDLVRVV